jgi:type III restriction enzyme
MAETLSNPILNSPYQPPESHFELGPQGPTGTILPGRRPSESFIPIPATRKARSTQQTIDFDATGERREQNSLINDIRREVERWRVNNWNGVTPYTRKLLSHWAASQPVRDDPVFFCQREAAETAIFLAEVAGRHGTADYRTRLDEENALHNNGLPRIGLKMATGTGKTVVMAMLIAWQTVNKVMTPRDARFAQRFLVVTPGITIRDRLGVLHPERDDSYFRERDLVPPDLWEALLRAQVHVVNYHAFLARDAKEIQGVASNTRKLLRGGRLDVVDAFQETPDMIASRIVRTFGSSKGGIVVMNDEAHHCYQDKLLEHPDEDADSEDQERNREARRWFEGIQHLGRKADLKAVYDLSATPYYLKGSGYNEGFIFPWVVSDFSLMDAIESGIVKIPRVPVDDDAAGRQVVYLRLWDNIQPPLPKRKRASDFDQAAQGWVVPEALEGAMRSLYHSYENNNAHYEAELASLGEPPPVLIIVCPNTVVSKLIFDWVAGRETETVDGLPRLAPGNLKLFSNIEDGRWVTRQRTILVDSVQLETGDPLGADFRKDAAHEIAAFKQAYRLRNPGADVESITDADLLREAMNTIGKKGKLGEHIRCVVSVAMLTEGWDANTVTHILGIRPFRSQLLCEQVVGRGLRRRDYSVNEATGRLEPEYAEVYGVPFAFIPSDRTIPKPKEPRPAVEVRSLPERWPLAIRFPKVDGYRVEFPDAPLVAEFTEESKFPLLYPYAPLWVQNEGITGVADEVDLEQYRTARPQEVAFGIARTLMEDERFFGSHLGDVRPWLFPQLVSIVGQWIDECFAPADGMTRGHLLLAQNRALAAEKVFASIARGRGDRPAILLPIIRRFDKMGSTDEVRFLTRKVVMDPPPTKSPLNHVVLDGIRGNSWEEALATSLEKDDRVKAYVKNERLGFTIPYVHEGRTHDYVPDFLVLLAGDAGERTLIVEVSGSRKSPGPTEAKTDTARDLWVPAINNWGDFGRWSYVEVHNPAHELAIMSAAIDDLMADRIAVGMPA